MSLAEARRRVVLAGGGHAHLAVLSDWAARPDAHTARVLVTPYLKAFYSGMLPGWMAGHYPLDALTIDLLPLAQAATAQLLVERVTALDAARGHISLSSGEALRFDLLSLATGGTIDTAPFAALGERLLPVRPVERFVVQWPIMAARLAALACPRLAVVGGGAAGVELALAARAALAARCARFAVVLVCPPGGFLSGHSGRAQRLARSALAEAEIQLIEGEARGSPDGLLLSNGAAVPADCVILATGSRPPPWLAQSGLACTADGYVRIGADLRSLSHPAVFAAGDMIERADRALPRSGVHAVMAGPVLAHNLRAAMTGGPLHHYQPVAHSVAIMATGDRRAIFSWGAYASAGRLEWRIKDWIDRRFIARYKRDTSQQGLG